MFGCSDRSLYFLDEADVIADFEGELNNSLETFVRRSASQIQFKKLKHLPIFGHYIKIPTQYFLKNVDDLNYNYGALAELLLDRQFCDDVAKSIVGKNVEKRNKTFFFSCLSGKRFGKNYFIIVWR